MVFVLEDDAQNGPDHVDSHRSPLLVISPYNRPARIHRFTNTTDVIRTIEGILGLGSMSQFDYFGRPLATSGRRSPTCARTMLLTPAVSLDEMNPARDARRTRIASTALDTEDESDDDDFSQILWQRREGLRQAVSGPDAHGNTRDAPRPVTVATSP